jgi:hypothetical protein
MREKYYNTGTGYTGRQSLRMYTEYRGPENCGAYVLNGWPLNRCTCDNNLEMTHPLKGVPVIELFVFLVLAP